MPIESYKVYTLSNKQAQYESDKWNGIVDNNNSTISTQFLLSMNNVGFTHIFSGDISGTYQLYSFRSPTDISSEYKKTNDSSEATLTYWATTDYGGTKNTCYFYYKKAKKYVFNLQLSIYINLHDEGAFLSTKDFIPKETTDPINFYSLGVMPMPGQTLMINISSIQNTSGVKPDIDDFSIRVNNGIRSTTTVYGRNFKLYTYKRYKNTGSYKRWNYYGTEGEFLTLNVVSSDIF